MDERFLFRAWDKQNKKMVYDFWDTPYYKHRVICRFPIIDCMQSTGIKENYAKEDHQLCYEGDLITGHRTYHHGRGTECFKDSQVIFKDGSFKVKPINYDYLVPLSDIDFEITGNIHEGVKSLEAKNG